MNRNAALVCLLFVGAMGCGGAEPLEFPPWSLPISEDIPVHGYAYVEDGDREGRVVEVERDLVVGASDDPERALYRPTDIAVDEEGRVWVADSGNHRVVAFDDSGELVLTLGNEGQGPGEFERVAGVAVVGDQVVASDSGNTRLSIWSQLGTHLGDQAMDRDKLPGIGMVGVSNGTILATLVASMPAGVPDLSVPWTVEQLSLEGGELDDYIELEATPPTHAQQDLGGGRRRFVIVPMVSPSFPLAALAPSGRAYVSNRDDYQILAFGPDGEEVWALRVAWTPPAPTEAEIEATLEAVNANGREPPVRREEVNWPERHPAIARMSLDGRGNLWVFPYRFRLPRDAEAPQADAQEDDRFAVDVYSPDGERLFAGLLPIDGWRAARGDHVYRLEDDPETGERVVARYRLDVSF